MLERRAIRTAAVALALLAAMAPGAPPAAAEALDGAVVYVDPYLPSAGLQSLIVVQPVEAADGGLYYLFSARVSVRDEAGEWSAIPLDAAASFARGRTLATNATAGWKGGGIDSFALAADATRVLLTIPYDARSEGPSAVEAQASGRTGAYNVRKGTLTPEAADALDDAPTPVEFNTTSAGRFAYSANVQIALSGTGYDVTVTPESPFVESSTVRTPHGTATVTLRKGAPAVAHFEGNPAGITATLDGTRFTLPAEGTFGDPIPRFLLCKTAVPCTLSISRVVTKENVTADGAYSISPPGEALTYAWDWGDGVRSTGATATHDWKRGGVYVLALTVTDESGRSASTSTPVTVLNQAPTATLAVAPATPTRIVTITVTAQATDVDGTVVQYSWTLDGAPAAGTGRVLTLAPGSVGLGAHQVRVLAKDDKNAFASAEATFTVVNLPPTPAASASRTWARPGQLVQFDDLSIDADGTVVTSSWTFGDGASLAGRSVQHAYAEEGLFTPRLDVVDDDGGSAALALAAVHVDGTPPDIALDVPPAPASGWYASTVRVGVDASDARDASPVLAATLNGATVSLTAGDVYIGQDGDNVLVVTATDAAGNAVTRTEHVKLDRVYPTVAFSAPSPYATGVERLVVNAADSASGVAWIEVRVDGELLARHVGPGPFEADWDTRATILGRPTIHVRVQDVAGHLTALSYWTVVVNPPGGIPLPPL